MITIRELAVLAAVTLCGACNAYCETYSSAIPFDGVSGNGEGLSLHVKTTLPSTVSSTSQNQYRATPAKRNIPQCYVNIAMSMAGSKEACMGRGAVACVA